MKFKLILAVRIIFSVILLAGAYNETGFITTCMLALLVLSSEMNTNLITHIVDTIAKITDVDPHA